MITRSIAPMTLGVVAVAALAGCSSGGDDALTPSGAPGTSSPAPSTSSASGAAPTVTHPLDASKFVHDPCAALTTNDLTGIAIGGATPKPDSDSNGTGCGWNGTIYAASAGVSIAWETVDKNGLSDLYTLKSGEGYWIPTTVSDYPAVFADPNDFRSSGTCVINVGVSDSLFFFVTYDAESSASSTACSRARQAAADVIKNLGGS